MKVHYFMSLLLCVTTLASAEQSASDYHFSNDTPTHLRYTTFDTYKPYAIYANNTLEWYYNSYNQSASIFSEEEVIATIKKAMAAWSQYGDITFVYKGKTTNNINDTTDYMVTVGYWSEGAFIDTFGTYSGYSGIRWNNNIIYEGYMILNAGDQGRAGTPQNLAQLQGLITHEIGHLLGIGHSNISNSIMYANPYHSYLYQQTLRDDDIAAVQSLYPPQFNRATLLPSLLLLLQ